MNKGAGQHFSQPLVDQAPAYGFKKRKKKKKVKK